MRSIAFHVEKGGTGKTTLTGNIGHAIAQHGRTVMIDADPQANLSSWFATGGIRADLADVLQGKADIDGAIIDIGKNLSMLGTIAIDGELGTWAETALPSKPFVFSDLIDRLETFGFDFALFDLGPGISTLEKSILAAVDEVVPVAAAEAFSFDGIEIFENELEKLRSDRRASFVSNKMVVNRLNRAFSGHVVIHDRMNRLDYQLYTLSQSTALSDCVLYHQSVFEYDPDNRNLPELVRLALDLAVGGENGSTEA